MKSSNKKKLIGAAVVGGVIAAGIGIHNIIQKSKTSKNGNITLVASKKLREEKRDELGFLLNSVKEIIKAFKVKKLDLKITTKSTGSLASTMPKVIEGIKGKKLGINIQVHTKMFDSDFASEAALRGLLATQIAKAKYYQEMSLVQVIKFGKDYLTSKDRGKQSFDSYVDLLVISAGFGKELLELRKLTKDKGSKSSIKDSEIKKLVKDKKELNKKLKEAQKEVENMGISLNSILNKNK